jgi:peptidoglycan/LPS O-acetylase OafA/YrhL
MNPEAVAQPLASPVELASPPARGASSALRLDYVDGIRGLAAVYVMLGHIYISLMFLVPGVELLPSMTEAMNRLRLPHKLIALVISFVSHCFSLPAVQVFIVISGYCLMLPVAQAQGASRGGFWQFVRRRAKRILPPYFAMLAVSLAILTIMHASNLLESATDDLNFGTITSHLLLVHNWSPLWYHAIDPPMWSIAVEWQIYFAFPLLLLPIWRRFGIVGSVVAAFALGMAPHFLLDGYLDWSCPWFLGLFALGMAAADLNLVSRPPSQAWLGLLPWGWISLALWVAILGGGAIDGSWLHHYRLLADPVIGLATMSLLVSCTRASVAAKRTHEHLALRLLSQRQIVELGKFSYSIYLAHYPPMLLFFYATLRMEMPVLARALLMYGVFAPMAIAFAYGFYLLFERPFIRRPAKVSGALGVVAQGSPIQGA